MVTLQEFFTSSDPDIDAAYYLLQQQEVPGWIKINGVKYPVYEDLNQLSFGQVISLRAVNSENDYDLIKKYLAIIYQPAIDSCKFDVDKITAIEKMICHTAAIQSIPAAYHYIKKLHEQAENETEKLKYEQRPEAKQAFVSDLDKFGLFGVVDTLAGGDPLKYEQIYELPYTVVFTKLWLDTERTKFNDRLYEIIKQKK